MGYPIAKTLIYGYMQHDYDKLSQSHRWNRLFTEVAN